MEQELQNGIEQVPQIFFRLMMVEWQGFSELTGRIIHMLKETCTIGTVRHTRCTLILLALHESHVSETEV